MNDLRKAAEMALKYFEDAHGLEDVEVAIKEALRQALAQPEQEPVAWMHNFIEGNVITHKPVDIGLHPERWTALYKDPTPCKTCQSLAMTVMNDQTYHEKVIQKREWVGLTDEDKEGIKNKATYNWDTTAGEYASEVQALTEAKLKEKNNVSRD